MFKWSIKLNRFAFVCSINITTAWLCLFKRTLMWSCFFCHYNICQLFVLVSHDLRPPWVTVPCRLSYFLVQSYFEKINPILKYKLADIYAKISSIFYVLWAGSNVNLVKLLWTDLMRISTWAIDWRYYTGNVTFNMSAALKTLHFPYCLHV